MKNTTQQPFTPKWTLPNDEREVHKGLNLFRTLNFCLE